ncbi:MAG: hypothetical protein AAF703_17005 [Cyanobacteria bacterium P01_D01_bin.105]
MDPVTWATLALVLVATKATEKIGEHLGESTISSAERLLNTLRRRSPDTLQRLAIEAGGSPIDVEVIDVEAVQEVKQVAEADSEVKAALKATISAIESEPISFQHLTKIAEKIGVVNLGNVDNQTNNITI